MHIQTTGYIIWIDETVGKEFVVLNKKPERNSTDTRQHINIDGPSLKIYLALASHLVEDLACAHPSIHLGGGCALEPLDDREGVPNGVGGLASPEEVVAAHPYGLLCS